jgi:hypothetical protein
LLGTVAITLDREGGQPGPGQGSGTAVLLGNDGLGAQPGEASRPGW